MRYVRAGVVAIPWVGIVCESDLMAPQSMVDGRLQRFAGKPCSYRLMSDTRFVFDVAL